MQNANALQSRIAFANKHASQKHLRYVKLTKHIKIMKDMVTRLRWAGGLRLLAGRLLAVGSAGTELWGQLGAVAAKQLDAARPGLGVLGDSSGTLKQLGSKQEAAAVGSEQEAGCHGR